jgi:phytoene synthase
MKQLFDDLSVAASKLTTRRYSTSFSIGIYCLNKNLHQSIYSIYGFVRFADEIVDSFHAYDKATLLAEFKLETFKAIERKVSINPILNSFQQVVNQFNIERKLIDCFLESMEMDLNKQEYSRSSYNQYVLGSAEVVGLMCLRVFADGNEISYEHLKPFAMKLGAAFQKVNFLRDMQEDYKYLGRMYFPNLNLDNFSECNKRDIESEIEEDFKAALIGIKQLPSSSRFGVYVAYVYYRSLFNKIKSVPSSLIMRERIRISNYQKISLLAGSYFKPSLRIL